MISSQTLDKLAVLLSGICVIHCLFAPVIITLLPILTLNTVWEEEFFHKLMVWVVVPTSLTALLIGCGKHRKGLILITGVIGVISLVVIAFWAHDLLTPVQERIATSIAGIVLAISHVLNFRACQKLTCDDEQCASKHHH